jgi:hypothetical protein
LSKAPEERPASARALARELRALQAECPWSEDAARLWWASRTARKAAETAVPDAHAATMPIGEKARAHPVRTAVRGSL